MSRHADGEGPAAAGHRRNGHSPRCVQTWTPARRKRSVSTSRNRRNASRFIMNMRAHGSHDGALDGSSAPRCANASTGPMGRHGACRPASTRRRSFLRSSWRSCSARSGDMCIGRVEEAAMPGELLDRRSARRAVAGGARRGRPAQGTLQCLPAPRLCRSRAGAATRRSPSVFLPRMDLRSARSVAACAAHRRTRRLRSGKLHASGNRRRRYGRAFSSSISMDRLHRSRPRLEGLVPLVRNYHMDDMVLGHCETETWDTNWKCLTENFMWRATTSPPCTTTPCTRSPRPGSASTSPRRGDTSATTPGFRPILPPRGRYHPDLTNATTKREAIVSAIDDFNRRHATRGPGPFRRIVPGH